MSLTSYHVEDRIALIQLDRPDQMNAISTEMLGELLMHLSVAREDGNVRAVVFSSTDYSCFSAGADIKEELDEAGRVTRMQQFADLYDAVVRMPKPTIAACHGYTVGGGAEIAIGCDIRIGPGFWRAFVAATRSVNNESFERWIAAVSGPMSKEQFARRPPPSRRPADMPLTTAALEQLTRLIAAALYPRRYALKNRERLNRLLMLMQLHTNGEDDVQAYSRTIRSWLETNRAAVWPTPIDR